MIAYIEGTLISCQPPQILIMVGGIGYEITVPMSTFHSLPALQEKVRLHTYLAIREDAHTLYGFADQSEKLSFCALLKVSGIGAKGALAILSAMRVEELAAAIKVGDIIRLRKIPGIGLKTAERLILELRDKLEVTSENDTMNQSTSSGVQADILHALMALGYSKEVSLQVIRTLSPSLSLSDGIRTALKMLANK